MLEQLPQQSLILHRPAGKVVRRQASDPCRQLQRTIHGSGPLLPGMSMADLILNPSELLRVRAAGRGGAGTIGALGRRRQAAHTTVQPGDPTLQPIKLGAQLK